MCMRGPGKSSRRTHEQGSWILLAKRRHAGSKNTRIKQKTMGKEREKKKKIYERAMKKEEGRYLQR